MPTWYQVDQIEWTTMDQWATKCLLAGEVHADTETIVEWWEHRCVVPCAARQASTKAAQSPPRRVCVLQRRPERAVFLLPRHDRGPCWHCCEAGRFHGPGRLRRGAGEGCKPVHQVVDVVEAVAPSVRMSSCHRLCDHAPSLGGCPQVQ